MNFIFKKRFKNKNLLAWNFCLVLFILSLTVQGQIDPIKRDLIQVGYNQPLQGRGPVAGYMYYYMNRPEFIRTNLSLRLVLAPVFLDSELGIKNLLGPNTDVGIGIAGGGFADSYSEIVKGNWVREESFLGHGAEVNIGLYHRINPSSELPIFGVIKSGLKYTTYSRDSATADNFELPQDQVLYSIRAGIRMGGSEPVLSAPIGFEISGWVETLFRTEPTGYGFNNDRHVEPQSTFLWTRVLWENSIPQIEHKYKVSLTLGTAIDPDRLNAWRLGGWLPLGSEWALNLPGYYFNEITAKRYAHLDTKYTMPIAYDGRISLIFIGSGAWVDYMEGFSQPGRWHAGVGGGFNIKSASGLWLMTIAYAHGFESIRSGGKGSDVIAAVCQIDLEAKNKYKHELVRPLGPRKLRGLDWLFGK